MPFVTVHGSGIYYASEPPLEDAGGPVVLFLHGAGGTHEIWRFQLRHLGPRWTALAVDLPGHGASQGDGCRTISAYRDFVRDFLEALGISRAALVGHSMGGGTAQSFALAHPGRLAALVLAGTGARLRVHPDIFTAIQRNMGEAARLISGWAYAHGAMPATVSQGAEAFARNRAGVLEGDFRACDAFDLMQEVAAIRVPTLVVCGEGDRLTPLKYARFLHEQIPGASLAVVPGAGHMAMLERPAEFNRILADFLDARADWAV